MHTTFHNLNTLAKQLPHSQMGFDLSGKSKTKGRVFVPTFSIMITILRSIICFAHAQIRVAKAPNTFCYKNQELSGGLKLGIVWPLFPDAVMLLFQPPDIFYG